MRLSDRSIPALGTYVLAALLAFLELAILWQALHPDVSPDFRAYYIDRTTTCLPQPVSGNYVLGTEIDFRYGGPSTRELRPCGWDGPAGDGMHAIGRASRLRFALAEPQDLDVMLELTGVTLPGPERQRVAVSANGKLIGELEVTPGQTERFTLPLPVDLIGQSPFVDLVLDFPDAIQPPGVRSDTQFRSVKLTAAALTPAY